MGVSKNSIVGWLSAIITSLRAVVALNNCNCKRLSASTVL